MDLTNTITVIYAYAGERTDEIIAGLNTELGSTWTREQLFEKTNGIWDWVLELDENSSGIYSDIVGNKKRVVKNEKKNNIMVYRNNRVVIGFNRNDI